MRKLLLTFLLIGATAKLFAQEVPRVIEFADMKLHLTEGARKEIQAKVDGLTRSPKYFQQKVDRVEMYMPIIERVLKEENVPADFRFLPIQESGFISDAVSSSDAVGFWQFKVPSATEVGLRVDHQVDERMNIEASTRGAAKYLKQNNMFFDNWLFALLAYNTGAGGAQKLVDENDFGKKRVEVSKKTHWYVKTFLAHMIAYQDAIKHDDSVPYHLLEYNEGGGKSLRQIGREFNVPDSLMEAYNKWLKHGRVPEDKAYTVIVPMERTKKIPANLLAADERAQASNNTNNRLPERLQHNPSKHYPRVAHYDRNTDEPVKIKINGLDGIVAPAGIDKVSLATAGGITVDQLNKYNDLDAQERLKGGQYYYLQKKRNRAKIYYHTVQPGETLWDVAQQYGIKLKKLLRKNRMREVQDLKPGRVLWLRYTRPRDVDIEYKKIAVPEKEKPAVKTEDTVTVQQEVKDTVSSTEPDKVTATGQDTAAMKVEKADTVQLSKDTLVTEKEMPHTMSDTSAIDTTKEELKEDSSRSEGSLVVQPKDTLSLSMAQQETDSADFWTKHEQEKGAGVDTQGETITQTYEVKAGDTYYAISKKFEVTVEDILEWNNLALDDPLSIGQILKIKGKGKAPQDKNEAKDVPSDENIHYVVKPGDTFYSIAKKHNVTVGQLKKWNDQNGDQLQVGQQLIIKEIP